MRLIKSLLAATVLLTLGLGAVPAFAGFLQFPLKCSDPLVNGVCPSGSIDYTVQGAYSANAMNSVLDHSMKLNPVNSYYPYGDLASTGGDGVLTAFNGESVSDTPLGTNDTCIGGTIYIHPDWDSTPSV